MIRSKHKIASEWIALVTCIQLGQNTNVNRRPTYATGLGCKTGKNLRYPAKMQPALACVKFLAANARCTITYNNLHSLKFMKQIYS